MDRPKIAICIATCRRPTQLERTLKSLSAQRFEAWLAPELRVLVADNDPAREGLAAVERMRAGFPWALEGLYEPQRGISHVRNRLVAAAGDCDYIAFIDDDETASPAWLCELCRHALRGGADVVLGPVVKHFDAPPPDWLPALLSDPHYPDGTVLPEDVFRTGNLLLRADLLRTVTGPFDPAFALTGGSDYVLGQQLAKQGTRAVWAAQAVVDEAFPATRATPRWYFQRRFRTGMTYARAQRVRRGELRGTARGLYRATGSLLLGSRDLLRALTGGPADRMRAAGLVLYGLGNLAGVTRARYEEYRTIHSA